jgi:hypothetical protein
LMGGQHALQADLRQRRSPRSSGPRDPARPGCAPVLDFLTDGVRPSPVHEHRDQEPGHRAAALARDPVRVQPRP